MRLVFLDTSFVYALFSARDSLRGSATTRLATLRAGNARFITTRTVLIEFLALCRDLGPAWRETAADFVGTMLADPEVNVITESAALFSVGLDLYRARPDKAYGMADCLAMELCRERHIVDVLTHDRDFVREGFRALLREEPGR